MTNPIAPGRSINPLITPVDLREAHRATLPNAAQVQTDGTPAGGLPPEEVEYRARRAAALQSGQEFEGQYGAGATAMHQFTRGALDALLAPGALAGALAEGTGDVTGWDGLRDFGRGLGRASQGKEAMAVFGAVPDALAYAGRRATGSTADEAIAADREDAAENTDAFDASVRRTREEEQAWPTLSAVSRLSGSVAFGLATGAAGGHATLAQQAGVAAVEGLGFGAQSAYEKDAPLRDVMTSALIGGALGGGLTAGIGKGLPALQRAASGGLRDFAEKRAVKAAVGNYKQAYNQITRWGKEPNRINRLGRKLLDRGVDLDDLDDTIRGIAGEVDDASTRLQTVAQALDDSGVTVSSKEALAPVDSLIAEYRKKPFGTYHAIADRLEREVAPLRGQADVKSFTDFWRIRRSFDDILYDETGKPIKGAIGDALGKLRGHLDESLTKAVDGADGEIGKAWRGAKEDYGDFATLKHAADELAVNREKNRWLSPSDHGLGAAGAMLAVASGDVSGLTGAAIGATVAGANKLAREKGPGMLARWADKLAGHADDAGHTVSVSAAGGREAQEAISSIERARRTIVDAAASAGENPAAQQAARRAAQQEVSEKLARKAGEFSPDWVTKPPTALQKVIHRGQILDQVAMDTSAAVQKVTSVLPRLDSPLAQRRLGKLLTDADAPAAIGSVQTRLAKLMEQLPRSEEGAALHAALKSYSQRFQTAGAPEVMRQAHDLVLRFSKAAEFAVDPVTKAFSARAATEIAQDLSSPAFGRAGELYGRLAKAPHEALLALGRPEVARDAFRQLELRGKLASVVREGGESLRASREALEELTGKAAPEGSKAELASLGRLFEQAEEAVTLDGGPVNRVLDYFAGKLEERVAGSLGAHVARAAGDQPGHVAETVVSHAIRSRLKHVAGILHTAGHGAQHTGIHLAQSSTIKKATATQGEGQAERAAGGMAARLLTPQEKQQQYRMRAEALSQITRDTDGEGIADGLAAIHAIAPGLSSAAANDFAEKLGNLERDMPRPQKSFRGAMFESLSSQDTTKAAAMWEATVDPLSVFEDFAAGTVNYDKIEYAWKQYPGLKLAAQAGLSDILDEQMDDEGRAGISESLLTQLDMLFAMDGQLQPTIAPDFVRTVDQVHADFAKQQQQHAKRGPLDLPTSRLTPVQRIAGQRR